MCLWARSVAHRLAEALVDGKGRVWWDDGILTDFSAETRSQRLQPLGSLSWAPKQQMGEGDPVERDGRYCCEGSDNGSSSWADQQPRPWLRKESGFGEG